ncbi:MAG: carcinine hydrolase/isopenicillin-N N-acyltransferase family protein [Proteobacteria bacterium]|nr:carcinine hydrolase/isopenicillin-N N-acyltransferase family protein [Pseudomonadota bacterium]
MSRELKVFSLVLITVWALLIQGQSVSHACTLWAAAGEKVEGEGVILAKNRDYPPQQNELRLVIPETGFKYFGIFPAPDNRYHGLVAGINEKGLAIVSATAGSVSRKKRNTGMESLNKKMLATYGSVDSVLANKTMFTKSHPVFYLIADKGKTAIIEVAPKGEISIRTTENGVLFHTNHYTDEKLLHANEKIGKSSLARFNRIGNLLNDHPYCFTVDDFVTFSEDVADGPDDSIWRIGGTPGKERTLATWIIYIPKNGDPELYVKFANPDEPIRAYNMKLDVPFWTEGIELPD